MVISKSLGVYQYIPEKKTIYISIFIEIRERERSEGNKERKLLLIKDQESISINWNCILNWVYIDYIINFFPRVQGNLIISLLI